MLRIASKLFHNMGLAALECDGYVCPPSSQRIISLINQPVAWEVTQTFATNWAWLLDEQTIQHSNFWRGERGESPLVLPDLGRSAMDDISGGILGEFVLKSPSMSAM